jgi:ketosteroid isomerase-like protein
MSALRAILFVILFLPACTRPDEADVLQVLERQQRAWNAGSVDGFMEGYWNSEELTFVSGGTLTKGYATVLARYRRSYSSPERMGELSFSNVQASLLSATSAFVTGEWRLKRSTDEPWGRFTLLLKHMPEGWKIVYDHTSSATE